MCARARRDSSWGVLHGVTLRGRTLGEALEMAFLVQKARADNLEALAREASSKGNTDAQS